MGLANGLRRGVRGLETLARMQAGRSMLPLLTAEEVIGSYEHYEALMNWAVGRVQREGYVTMVAEPHHAPRAARECLMKPQFEGRDAPAAYIAKIEVLAVYAKARTTGGVLDLGFSCSLVVPVL